MQEVNFDVLRKRLHHTFKNNRRLEDMGETPLSMCIEGDAGAGKTSFLIDEAKSFGMTVSIVQIAQFEDIGDMQGMPFREHEAINSVGEVRWINELQIGNIDNAMKLTGNVRTSYAPPQWVPREFNPNGTVFIIDDFTRANPNFMQAVMELINTGTYMTWKLPKYSTILLSSNPDNGEYNVTSIDNAQLTRFSCYSVKFDYRLWAKWAEEKGVDGRCINFCLQYGEELFKKENGVQIVNARSYYNFCKDISGYENWNDKNTLLDILNAAKGYFVHDTNNTVGNFFTSFISNQLDNLISPKDMLEGDWNYVKVELEKFCYEGDSYRADIASVLATRLLNYTLFKFDTNDIKETIVVDRLIDFIDNDKKLISEDLLFYLIKTLSEKHRNKVSKFLTCKKIRDRLIL